MLKCWKELPSYKDFVRENLQTLLVEGWCSFVIKEKLKLVKGCLKAWHQTHTHNLEGIISLVKDRISCLDWKTEVDEVDNLSAQILSFTKLHSNM